MKYLQIERSIHHISGERWFLDVKKEYKEVHRFKFNKLAEKVKAYLDEESDEIIHNGKKYDLDRTKFTHEGNPIYILTINEVPKYFYHTIGRKYEVSTVALLDKDEELFKRYGYIDKAS